MAKTVTLMLAWSVFEIDFEKLYREGIKVIVFDADHTIVPAYGKTLSRKLAQFLRDMARIYGFRYVICSNSGRNFKRISAQLNDAVIVQPKRGTRRKPHPDTYREVCLQFYPLPMSAFCFVGDKLKNDVEAPLKCGYGAAVLVNPMGLNLPGDWLLRLRQREDCRLIRVYGIGRPIQPDCYCLECVVINGALETGKKFLFDKKNQLVKIYLYKNRGILFFCFLK